MALTKITLPTAQLLTVDQAIRHLKIDYVDTDLQSDIAELIVVACTAAEDRLQATLLPTSWRQTLDQFPLVGRHCVPQIRLPMGPVISITSISYRDPSGSLIPLPDSARRLEGDLLLPAFGATWPRSAIEPGAVRIDYLAGYQDVASVPRPIVQWIKMALADLYMQRGRSAERPAVPQNFVDGLLDVYRNTVV